MPDVTRVTRTIAAHAHARNMHGDPVRSSDVETDEQDQNDENPE
jgi:hypothetical protein